MSSESDSSSDEFFDAEDVTPKSRGHSLRKKENPLNETPKIKVSYVRAESLSLELGQDEDNVGVSKRESSAPRYRNVILIEK